ncbi:Hypothetical protein FKW44_015852 [Caligus rogercresseyi]|uniref:Uncharacterized protein n=1 Tax=Caligus rogercresseyi TaxID=217165 RepID=A0A7T8H185_CALRO|nr:Hypothetical protein FKW44_015852 [Caligus rogercresseyi]
MVLPCLKTNSIKSNYVFQQDSAPGHKAKIPQKWYKCKFGRILALVNVTSILTRLQSS